ncbi:NUDIX domain-containing protein [Dysgonomonas sp. 216]|uniref:NUDIX hydrolase n=1 Tax=Dysgonomonas sp. 216 TaxID=2302934 RepID=UPI0013D64CD5|nr:NUDIX domain-containing protein [Dysgonomonas sp. 216]NDW18843.1 NUDIX domain-containing protein [Dysgonomonas sp. 216]
MLRTAFGLSDSKNDYLPGISVDCVILGFFEGSLRVLLNKYDSYDKWLLPGGLVFRDESIEDAVDRHLKSRTGLRDIYTKQFYTFGAHDRINVEEQKSIINQYNLPEGSDWFINRFVGIGYYALVEYSKVQIYSENEGETVSWHTINNLPALYADHKHIIQKALDDIYYQIGFVPIGYELLPDKFTMPELRQVYESFLGKELDRRNFQRKMLSIGLFEKLNETRKVGAHKAPNLYSFNKERYTEALNQGLQLIDWKFS